MTYNKPKSFMVININDCKMRMDNDIYLYECVHIFSSHLTNEKCVILHFYTIHYLKKEWMENYTLL